MEQSIAKIPQGRVMTANVGGYQVICPPEQLILAPDCGMLQLSRAAAWQRLANLALAARELDGPGQMANMGQSPDWIVTLQSLGWDAAAKICTAAVLGAIVGLERVWRGHPAGLQTNLLIAISSCLFTILSIEGFPLQGAAQDTARVAAQIVTGVGFLGAGAVLASRGQIRGLTTAASIWLVAAIGMAVGTGLHFLAIFTTLLSVGLLVLLRPLSRRLELQAGERTEDDSGA